MISVLTYNAPHRKTQDLLYMLKLSGYDDVTVFAIPWQERENFKPLFKHRPSPMKIMPLRICNALGYNFREVKAHEEATGEQILIAGCGVITPSPVIINSHPGYLPHGRGLDALKWAIYNNDPIGVTTYIIGQECDTGMLIEQRLTPIYPTDDFYTIAMRHYELEITMLVDALSLNITDKKLDNSRSVVHKRMPHDKELVIRERVKQIRHYES